MCSPLPSAPRPLLSAPSSPPRCPELDLSLLHSPNPTHPKPKPKPHPPREIPCARTMHQTSSKKSLGRTHRQVRFEEEHVVVKVTAEPGSSSSNLPSNNEQRGRGHRRRGRRHGEPKDHRACPPASASNGESIGSGGAADCLLEEAEPNTLLALKAELESLEGAEFNSQHAVQETLRSSVRTKNLINTKATEAVNFPPSQHLLSALVSLSVEEDQLINQALRDRLPLAPPTRLHDNKQTDGPSLLPFVNSVLFREMPFLEEEPGNKPRPQPTTRPAHSTFDLYRRHTQWQA